MSDHVHSARGPSDELSERYIPSARERVEIEIASVSAKNTAWQNFLEDINRIEPVAHNESHQDILVDASGTDKTNPALSIYKQHFSNFHDGDLDNSKLILKAISDDLHENIAIHIATSNSITSHLKKGLNSCVNTEIAKLETVETALDKEKRSLREIEQELKSVQSSINKCRDSKEFDDNFDCLVDFYEILGENIQRLDEVSESRQNHIRETTVQGKVEVNHSQTIELLYSEFAIDYPALRDIAATADLCTELRSDIYSRISHRY